MCKCKNVDMGSYARQTTLWNPFTSDLVDIDTCLVQEIAELWYHNIETIECCCGHNTSAPYIAIHKNEWSESKMKELGYEVYPHESNSLYVPQSIGNPNL